MAPRGVATPDVRERLFTAAERVVGRDGPGALTSRAVTTEAGCAKGLLHAHFAGLDEFVAELCLDRLARTAAKARELSGLVGRNTVEENLGTVAFVMFDSGGPALASLAMVRPAAAQRFREALAAGAPGFTAIEGAVVRYLDEERELGRIPQRLHPHTAALAVVGAAHHLLMTAWPGSPDPRSRMERLVAEMVKG
ncbi:TetR/AcrR family transcriptional regulator [Streptomyces sp. NPDC056600]|uniref:TetR/AcrR family transcriptional regulator n=1 Tax=Streptomyces sp. NPDC056600 TaxID=3345874 RepID=UPI003681D000